jgi:hypothetical protein
VSQMMPRTMEQWTPSFMSFISANRICSAPHGQTSQALRPPHLRQATTAAPAATDSNYTVQPAPRQFPGVASRLQSSSVEAPASSIASCVHSRSSTQSAARLMVVDPHGILIAIQRLHGRAASPVCCGVLSQVQVLPTASSSSSSSC